MKINEIKKVVVTDWSDYDPDLCSNGGKYAYYTEYARNDDGTWAVSYGTSADFGYRSCCGVFGECECDSCDSSDFEHITTSEMLKRLAEDVANDDCTIECYDSSPSEEEEKLVINIDE